MFGKIPGENVDNSCCMMLRKPAKLKLLLGILHLNDETFNKSLNDLVEIVKQGMSDDDDEWISSTASIVAFWMTKNKECRGFSKIQ